MPDASLDDIRARWRDEIGRGIGEPMGLVRAFWRDDMQALLEMVEQLTAAARVAAPPSVQRTGDEPV